MLAPRQRYALLLAVLVAGGLLRFGAIGYGLPRHDLGQDELITSRRVSHGVLVGRPGWPVFHWPNLNIHISQAVVAATRWVEQATDSHGNDRFLIGRATTAALCTLTLVVLYLIGARLFDPAVGIAAAGVLAVIPLHAFRSWLWVPDAPMTLFYTLALLAAVWILRRPSGWAFVGAGVAVGLATATKYNGVGAALPVIVAAVLAWTKLPERRRSLALAGRLGLAGAVSVAAFFAVNPHAFGRFPVMLEGMRFVGTLYSDQPPSGFLGWHIVSYVAGSFFAGGYEGVGPLITTLALAGWLVLLLRPSRAGLLAWLPGLLYLLLYSSLLGNAYERVFLPLTPHLALLAAVALVGGARELEALARRSWPSARLAGGVVTAVLLIAAVPAVAQTIAARHGETRVEAVNWLESSLPSGAIAFREWDMVAPPGRRYSFNGEVALLWADGRTAESVADRYDFVVTTSTTWQWVLRQRRRPGFDRRAAEYDALFDGPRFELAARFPPDLLTFGPEVRVYRSLPPRGRLLAGGKAYLDLQRTAWVSNDRLRAGRGEGIYRLLAPGELIAGKARVTPAGRYALEVTAESPEPVTLRIGFGDARRSFGIAGRERLQLERDLPSGQVWWEASPGPGFGAGDELTVSRVRLIRRAAVGGARFEEASPAGDAPPEAQQASAAAAAPNGDSEETTP